MNFFAQENPILTKVSTKKYNISVFKNTQLKHGQGCTPGWDKKFHFVSAQFSEQKFRLKQRDSNPYIGEIIIHNYL